MTEFSHEECSSCCYSVEEGQTRSGETGWKTWTKMMVAWPDFVVEKKKWINLHYILEIEPIGFAEWFQVGTERWVQWVKERMLLWELKNKELKAGFSIKILK